MLLDYFFLESTTPTPAAQGGHYVKDHKKQLKAHQRAIEAREQAKLAEAQELRRQIEEAANPPVIQDEQPESITTQPVPAFDPIPQLKAKLTERENELLALSKQMEAARQMQQDEDDMAVILNLLNKEMMKYSIH